MRKKEKDIIEVMQSYVPGEKWEWRKRHDDGPWGNCNSSGPEWDWGTTEYRKKPEPKLRPWKSSEIPTDALFRRRGADGAGCRLYYLTTFFDGSLPNVVFDGGVCSYNPVELLRGWEYQLNKCDSAWYPCGEEVS